MSPPASSDTLAGPRPHDSTRRGPRLDDAEPPVTLTVVEPPDPAPARAAAAPAAEAPPSAADDIVFLGRVEEKPPPLSEGEAPSPAAPTPAEGRPRTFPFRAGAAIASAWDWMVGSATLLFGLAALAAAPVLQVLTLGYLLECSGRIARTGRLRDGFVGVRKAARVGTLVGGTLLMLAPLRWVSDMARSADMIDPGGPVARAWGAGLVVLTVLTVGHVLLAWYSGGRLRHFFWPLLAAPFLVVWGARRLAALALQSAYGPHSRRGWLDRLAADIADYQPLRQWFPPAILWAGLWRGRMYAEARDAVWDFVVGLRLPYYFWLGLRGLVGSVAWLAIPVLLLIGALTLPEGINVLAFFLGFPLMALAAMYLPFAQVNFAAENRFAAMFDLGRVRECFRRAPVMHLLALVVTLGMAIPLYLFKVEDLPPSLALNALPTLFFVALMAPTRLLQGWAVGLARRRERKRHWILRWPARVLMLPAAMFYVLIVHVWQYLAFSGAASLFEQHAFLVPAPFLRF